MNRKIVAVWMSLAMVLGIIVIIVEIAQVVAAPTTWYVDDVPGSGGPGDPPEDFTSIQDAINAAQSGDTVFVYSGTYVENILIDKTINLTGENKDTTIIDGDWSDVVSVKTNWVNITGFSVTNGEYGIYLFSSSYNNITGNDIYSNDWGGFDLYASCNNNIIGNNILSNTIGISLSDSSNNNTVTANNVSNHSDTGIFLDSSSNNNIISNNFSGDGIFISGNQLSHFNSHNIPDNNIVNGKPLYYYKDCSGINIDGIPVGQLILANCTDINVMRLKIENTDGGIEVAYSYNITIVNNNISNNDGTGIFLYMSSNNFITGNNIMNNDGGIQLRSSSNNNKIITNNVNSNGKIGVYISSSSNNAITGNNISMGNSYGIDVISSSNNNITNNNISNNWWSIRISSSSDNRIYHNNFIDNTYQAYDDTNNGNQWDNGYPSGGNYWSDYIGSDNLKGPNQNIPGSDGIGDMNYSIDADSVDNYPLIGPFESYELLKEGWNLISLPLIQTDQNLTKVLELMNGCYNAAQWYDVTDKNDPWKHHKVGKPFGNNLFHLNETMGFWIHINQPGGTIFVYNGTPPTTNQTILLHPGWNLVGYPSLTNYNRTEGLNNLTFDVEVDAIWTFDAPTQKWEDIDPSDYFEQGRGYWIHAKVECEWEVPL